MKAKKPSRINLREKRIFLHLINFLEEKKKMRLFIYYIKIFFKIKNLQFEFSISRGQLSTLIQNLCLPAVN